MPVILAARGLCAACDHEAKCIYPRKPDQPVLNCEEWVFTPHPDLPRGDDPFVRQMEDLMRPPEPASTLLGLCTNCDNRHACIYPKPDGGVWHCDEYR